MRERWPVQLPQKPEQCGRRVLRAWTETEEGVNTSLDSLDSNMKAKQND